jgi:hypothetical protein
MPLLPNDAADHPRLFVIMLLTNLCPGKKAVDNEKYIQQYAVCIYHLNYVTLRPKGMSLP